MLPTLTFDTGSHPRAHASSLRSDQGACEWGGAHLLTSLLAQQASAAQDQNLLAKEGSWTQAAQQPGSKAPGNLSPTAGQGELSPAWRPSSPGAGRGRCWGAEGCPVITATLSRGGTPGARAGPHIHRWHQGTLSTKCQIVVSFCIKNRIKKRLLLVTATRLASTTHPGDTRTRANIKIHIVQDRQGRALIPPPTPTPGENSLHSKPAAWSILLLPAMPHSEGRAPGGGQRLCSHLLQCPGL